MKRRERRADETIAGDDKDEEMAEDAGESGEAISDEGAVMGMGDVGGEEGAAEDEAAAVKGVAAGSG